MAQSEIDSREYKMLICKFGVVIDCDAATDVK